MEACRHCSLEDVPDDAQDTYIAALCKDKKETLRDKIKRIERERQCIPFVSFTCFKCFQKSTLSFKFHREVYGGLAYDDAWAYYNSLAKIERST